MNVCETVAWIFVSKSIVYIFGFSSWFQLFSWVYLAEPISIGSNQILYLLTKFPAAALFIHIYSLCALSIIIMIKQSRRLNLNSISRFRRTRRQCVVFSITFQTCLVYKCGLISNKRIKRNVRLFSLVSNVCGDTSTN